MRSQILTSLCILAAPAPALAQTCDPATIFGPATTAFSTNGPFEVRAADLNNDGLVDLVTANAVASSVAVALATAPGVFAPPTEFPVGGIPRDVRLADLDADGDIDAVAFDSGSRAFIPLLNDGTGALTAQPSLATVSTNIFFFTLADADNDGDADILGGSISVSSMNVFLNNGDGTFGPVIVTPGVPGQEVVAGDMNNDGNIDAIITDFPGDAIGVMLGNADGTFNAPIITPVVIPGGEAPTGLDVADFNADGWLDVATCMNSGEVAVLPGLGTGALDGTTSYDIGGSILIDLLAADLDGDGDQDIATQNILTDEITLLINDGAGVFDTTAVVPAPSDAFTLADIDGDLDPDLLLPQRAANIVSVLSNACGPFGPVILSQPRSVLRSPGDPAATFEVTAADADDYQWRLDGVPLSDDAVFSGTQTDTLVVGAGAGIEGLLDVVVSSSLFPGDDRTSDPAVIAERNDCPADVNADGLLTPADFTAWLAAFNLGCN